MKTRLLILLICVSFVKHGQAQFLPLNYNGSYKFEQDPINKNIFVIKIFNFNDSPVECWTMFSSVDTLNERNFSRLFIEKKVIPQGKHLVFYPDSIIKFEEDYYLGKPVGVFKGYYKNGKVRFIGSINEKSNGKVTHFYPDSSIRRVGNVINFLSKGKVTEYYLNGKVHSVTPYLYGKKEGKYISYYDDGKKKREIVFNSGKIETEKCFDVQGKKVECRPVAIGPKFPGGDEAFRKELEKINYLPNISDTSVCNIILSVNNLGKVELVNFSSPEGKPLYEAVENWVKQLPEFKPAMFDETNCESQVEISFPVFDGKVVFMGGLTKIIGLLWKNDFQEDIIRNVWNYKMTDKKNTLIPIAEFPGGESALLKFLANMIVYPTDAKRQGIQGSVYVSFTVDEEGNVINPTIRSSSDPVFDSEALRVVKQMPKWKPAIQDSKPVKSAFTVPIRFALQ